MKKVTNLKDVNGSSVFISWRRGTKKTAGDTRRVIAQKNEASWDERIVFESKLFMDPKSQKFDEKAFSLTLKEVCPVSLAPSSSLVDAYAVTRITARKNRSTK